MTFNTALSGLSAASSDLRITGNNIANASTIGFKASRAEFADVYSSSLLGSGSNQIGGGVKLANIAQQFDQGTISFTNNSLDLAVDGNGFFVLSDNGARAYTRAGSFGVDDEGFVVANSGSRVQGFTANQAGTLSGILGDMQINTSNIAPQQTTLIEAGGKPRCPGAGALTGRQHDLYRRHGGRRGAAWSAAGNAVGSGNFRATGTLRLWRQLAVQHHCGKPDHAL